ncbi:hypothetical protein F0562_019120 [Nyssa sinensis]|uniref:Proteasome endopeptidase complex n=1 Tax=Nyssa sinensis TaxID=561372 RepID=A0A5J4ZF28_9ASTE|nr:hypothetical protein F0562_019120 [Nyssa sinensis]
MSTGYNILTCEYSKICKLADKCVMASSGFQADVRALQKVLAARHLVRDLSASTQEADELPCNGSTAIETPSTTNGKGCVFAYDAVGSFERVGYSSQGSGSTLIMPFLNNQVKSPSPLILPAKDAVTPLSESEAIDLVKTCFACATERDIFTGNKLEIVILNADGIRRECMELRKD